MGLPNIYHLIDHSTRLPAEENSRLTGRKCGQSALGLNQPDSLSF